MKMGKGEERTIEAGEDKDGEDCGDEGREEDGHGKSRGC